MVSENGHRGTGLFRKEERRGREVFNWGLDDQQARSGRAVGTAGAKDLLRRKHALGTF